MLDARFRPLDLLVSAAVAVALAVAGTTVVLVASRPAPAGARPAAGLVLTGALLDTDSGRPWLAPGDVALVGLTVRNLAVRPSAPVLLRIEGQGVIVEPGHVVLDSVPAGLARQVSSMVRVHRPLHAGEAPLVLAVRAEERWLGDLTLPAAESPLEGAVVAAGAPPGVAAPDDWR